MAALNAAGRLELPFRVCVIPLAAGTQCLGVGNNFIFLVLDAIMPKIKVQII